MKLSNRFPKYATFLVMCIFILTPQTYGQNLGTFEYTNQVKATDRICFTLYTVHENTLKMTAQFYPIQDYEPFESSLQIKKDGEWVTVNHSRIEYPGYTAHFRIDDWDDTKEVEYRVEHNEKAYYTGIVRKNPIGKDEFVMATFSCNSIFERHDGNISKKDIIDNMKKINPDLLFFAGDQVYNHSSHLIHWLQFGRDFGDIMRNTPTITIPDDHDMGQGNLWGAGGVVATTRNGSSGGYYMPVEYIKEVERAQTSHLPDPFDPTPIEQGIGVYYNDLKWGGMSFAILEDRKFKTGPDAIRDKVKKEKLNARSEPKYYDSPDANLLGERQLHFIRTWTTDWEDAEMKSVLSQTIFAQSANYGDPNKHIIHNDFDSNGWPQSGRNKALKEIRKSFSAMVAGDQHLGSVIQHGVDDWNDAGYSFAVPAVANFWLRYWIPGEPGNNRKKNAPDYTGEFLDGFGNKMTMHAVANPADDQNGTEGKLSTRAAGYGIIRYNKPKRTVTFECWERNVDTENGKQYPGWPVTVNQADNYTIKNGFELPKLELSKPDQVVTVIQKSTNELMSSIRIKGNVYQPKVHSAEVYLIKIGESDNQKIIEAEAKKTNKKVEKISLN